MIRIKYLPGIIIALAFCFFSLHAQIPTKYSENLVDYREVVIDVNTIKNTLESVQMRGSASQNKRSNTVLELPMPLGQTERFKVVEAPILSAELSRTRPEVKSYMAKGLDDPTATARFNITSSGFYAVIKGVNGIAIIEKMTGLTNENRYITYYDHDIISNANVFECETNEDSLSQNMVPAFNRINSCFQIGDNLRNYDLVLTCSGEFYALNGGTNALVEAALLARIAQVNAVYETELATTFTIVEFLLNDDPATDPYSNPTNTLSSITETENYINTNATVGSWDIGHGFHEITCGGGCGWAGIAGLAVVCTTAKARGYTYLPNDIPTAITVLVHEFGHQFSSRHTNYGCNSNNACSRYEPGQGSTIMSTGAGCDAGDFFANRTDYFSVASLQNMIDYMNAGLFVAGTACNTFNIGGWSDCADLTPTGNSMPTSNANANNIDGLLIPHSTPFVLSGTASDADGTSGLTYNWEQYDTDYSGSDAPDDTSANATAPLFRSFPPSTSNERTVPRLSSILAGTTTTGTGEVLPSAARNLTWRLTVRDNEIGGGGVACDQIALTVGNDGPFEITSQNATTAWFAGDTETITWDVANTDSPAYTCPDIDILYSSDGGNTFSTILASGVPNNGSFNITVPGLATTAGRIKIVCTGQTNIFFDINDVDIAVISSCGAVGGTIANSDNVSAIEGDESLNLNLQAGLPITGISGTLDASDDNTNLIAENNGSGTCISFGNTPKFETITLAAGSSSNVTFARTVQADYFNMISLFDDTFNTSNVCENWLDSNGDYDGAGTIFFSSGFDQPLTAGTRYVLLSSGFSSATPPVGNYEITFSETLYNLSALDVPGYLYTYVIVDESTGNIVDFDSNSDLSDASMFAAGNYAVYGLSYLASETSSSYIGGSFSQLQADLASTTFCGALSSNSVSVTITPYIPTLYTYDLGAWTPANPIGTADARDNIQIQNGDYTLSDNLECYMFTVNPGASLIVGSGITLSVNDVLHLESSSMAYSSLILNGTINGIINYHRYTAQVGPIGSNDLIASPFSGQNFGTFETANANLAASGSLRAFGPYNTASGAYENYDVVLNAMTLINQGIGYRAGTTDGSTLTFSGNVASVDVSDVPISDAAAGNAWNLIGNPYPSYLDFDLFFQQNRMVFDPDNAFQAIYGYNANTSSPWTVWNQATIDEGSVTELITPGQGFFVKARTGGGLVDFTTAMRTSGNSDDFILGRQALNQAALCQLNLIGSSNTAHTQIYFIEGTTRGLDVGYDAGVYQGNVTEFSIFSKLIEDNSGVPMAIQSVPYIDLSDIVIPIGVEAPAGSQLQIGIDETYSLQESINVYLEDVEENTFTLLNTSTYIFTPNSALSGLGRFYLHFSSRVLSDPGHTMEDVVIYVNDKSKEIIISGSINANTRITLNDIQGRIVYNETLRITSNAYRINSSHWASGVYIVLLNSLDKTKIQKIIIN